MKKSILTICFAALTVLVANFATPGQFKIPKIVKPKQNPPVETPQTPNGQNPNEQTSNEQKRNSPPADRQSSGERLWTEYGDYVDDGFTWFEAKEASERGETGLTVDTGWTLKPSIRLMGVYPNRSAFKFVVSRAGKPVGTTRCEAKSYNIPRSENPQEVSYVYVDGCNYKDQMTTKETGKLDVEVFLIDGASGAERSLRKYKIDVVRVERVNGQIGKYAKPESPRYVVSRHAEAPVSVLFLRPGFANDYFHDRDGGRVNQVEIYFSLSPTKEGWGLPNAYLRCSVDGKRIKLADQGSQTDIVPNKYYPSRMSRQIYSDRLAAPYSAGGPVYEDDFGFRIYRAALPLTYGAERADPSRTNLKEYPGKWECSITDNGTPLRTWRWTVGADGMPAKHPEQNGNVNLFPNSYLAETEIPAGGTVFDKRLVPVSATEGFFYGQKWTTAEGRALAGRVPTKGSPLPLPSNKAR
jgi:hypothetical protein